MNTLMLSPPVFGQLLQLGKPRVVSLIVFTAIIGMFLATPGLPPAQRLLFGTIGIALLATSAAALNLLRCSSITTGAWGRRIAWHTE